MFKRLIYSTTISMWAVLQTASADPVERGGYFDSDEVSGSYFGEDNSPQENDSDSLGQEGTGEDEPGNEYSPSAAPSDSVNTGDEYLNRMDSIVNQVRQMGGGSTPQGGSPPSVVDPASSEIIERAREKSTVTNKAVDSRPKVETLPVIENKSDDIDKSSNTSESSSFIAPAVDSEKASISLIVSAHPEQHLTRNLKSLLRVNRTQKIPIDKVLIVQGDKPYNPIKKIPKVMSDEEEEVLAPAKPQAPVRYPESPKELARMIERGEFEGVGLALDGKTFKGKPEDIAKRNIISPKLHSSEKNSKVTDILGSSMTPDARKFYSMMENLSDEETEQIEKAYASKLAKKTSRSYNYHDSAKVLRDLGIEYEEAVSGNSVMEKLGVSTSPVWIVRVGGRDHVFEGERDPSMFFNSFGEFIAEE